MESLSLGRSPRSKIFTTPSVRCCMFFSTEKRVLEALDQSCAKLIPCVRLCIVQLLTGFAPKSGRVRGAFCLLWCDGVDVLERVHERSRPRSM
jgi:hypothetical protein